jgi:hypothetical protein
MEVSSQGKGESYAVKAVHRTMQSYENICKRVIIDILWRIEDLGPVKVGIEKMIAYVY